MDKLTQWEILEGAVILESTRGIYFLIKDDEVVYVGQSVNCEARVQQHRATKDFERVTILPVPSDEELDAVEAYYICKFAPLLNAVIPWKTGGFVKAATLVWRYGYSTDLLDELEMRYLLEPGFASDGEKVYDLEEVEEAVKALPQQREADAIEDAREEAWYQGMLAAEEEAQRQWEEDTAEWDYDAYLEERLPG